MNCKKNPKKQTKRQKGGNEEIKGRNRRKESEREEAIEKKE